MRDLLDYVHSKGWEYRERGDELKLRLCPICNGGEHRDEWKFAFSLSKDGWPANCKRGNCGWKGDLRMLQREMGDAPSRDYQPRFIPSPKPKVYTRPKNETDARHQALLTNEPMMRYLTGTKKATVKDAKGKEVEAQGRGFTAETIKRFRLGLASKSFKGPDDTWVDRMAIAIPYLTGGELVRTKYRTTAKDFAIDKGSEPILYNIDAASGPEVVICEGEFDVIALAQCGIDNAVSVPDGCSDNGWIDHNWDWLEGKSAILIAVDSDEGGRKLEEEIVRRLGRDRCLKVDFPHKDANGCLQAGVPEEAIAECVRNAKPYPIDGLKRAADLYDELLELYDDKKAKGVSTGWKNLDAILGGIRPGEITTVTGTPSSGKSEWVNALLVNLAQQGVKSVVASLENKAAKVLRSHVTQYSGFPFYGPHRIHRQDLEESALWLHERIHYCDIEDGDQSWETVEEVIRYAARRYGCQVAVADPLTMLLGGSHKDSERFDIDNIYRDARRLVASLGIHLFLVAHPRKLASDDAVADLYDISGSAGPRNLSWNGLSVWRNRKAEAEGRNEVIVYVKKNRELGSEGPAHLLFNPSNKRYYDNQGGVNA